MEYAWSERGPATTLSAPDAARELVGAYQTVSGKPPALPLAELNLAHLWLETKGTSRMWRFNWGNLSAGGYVDGEEKLSWKGDVWRPPWFELAPSGEGGFGTPGADAHLQDLHQKMLAGTAPSAFRAYDGHPDGAKGYVDLLNQPGFAPLLRAGRSGDARAYAQAVVDTGYCRDRNCQPDRMAPELAALVKQFRQQGVFAGLGLPSSGPRSSSGDGAVLLSLALFISKQKEPS